MDSAAAAAPRAKPSITAPPTSALLGRLQTFLPALQASNASLGPAPPEVAVLLEPAGGSEEEEGSEGEEEAAGCAVARGLTGLPAIRCRSTPGQLPAGTC